MAYEVALVECFVNRANLDANLVEALLNLALILVVRECYSGLRDKDHFGYTLERFCNLTDRIFEIRLSGIGRIGN